MRRLKQSLSLFLCVVFGLSTVALNAQAVKHKKEVSLNRKTIKLTITKKGNKTSYPSAKIKLKKQKGVKIKKTKYKLIGSKKVVTVTKSGKITAKKTGSAKIKVTVKYTYKKRTKKKAFNCKVKVTKKVIKNTPAEPAEKPENNPTEASQAESASNPAEETTSETPSESVTESAAETDTTADVKLEKDSTELTIHQNAEKLVRDTCNIKVNSTGAAEIDSVYYSSSDETVIRVDDEGKITPKKMGATKVNVFVNYSVNGEQFEKELEFSVRVNVDYKNILKAITFKRNTLATFVGNSEGISPCYQSDIELDNEFYLWDCIKATAADDSIVEIGQDGLLIGKKEGTTSVTIESTDGSNLKKTATLKVYKNGAEMLAQDDLYNSERYSFLPEVMKDWTEETKQRYIDSEGNVKWSLFSQADIEYKANKAKLIEEFSHIEKQPDNTSEDVLASILSTAKQTREGKGDKEFFNIIKNKLTDKVLSVKSLDELLKLCGEMGHNGISNLLDSSTYFRKAINEQLASNIEDGTAQATDEEVAVEYKYYPIIYPINIFSVNYSENNKAAARKYLDELLELIGVNDSKLSESVFKISSEIAVLEQDKADWNDEDQNKGAPSKKEKFSEIDKQYPNLKLKDYITKVGYDLNNDDYIYLAENNTFKYLDKHFENEDDLDALKAYTALCVLSGLHYYTRTGIELDYRFQNAGDPEKITEENINDYIEERQKYFLDNIQYEIPWDVDHVYTKRYYSKTYKEEFENLVNKFVEEYRTAISESWMSDKAKNNMLKKLNKTKFNNAFPNEDEYKLLTVRDDLVTAEEGGNFADNLICLRKYKADLMRLTVGKKAGEYTWWAPSRSVDLLTFAPWTNNASFDWIRNQAFFAHVGISTLFKSNPDKDEKIDVQNIAYMSCTVGHEIGHAFDNLGSCFNADGNIQNLWSNDDKEIYNKKVSSLAEFYEHSLAYPDWDNKKALYQNGMNVVGEAMADLGGTEIALRILKKTYPNDDAKIRQFYKYTAQMWLNTSMDNLSGDALDVRIENEHPAYRLRTNNVASMMEDFYRVFDVKETDAMYVAPGDRVELWSKAQ